MKRKRNKIILFTCLFVFFLSISFIKSPVLNNDISKLETATDNYLFNGKEYDIELNDVYDDANLTKIYTGANFSYVFMENESTTFNEAVSNVNNTNYKSPSNTDVSMLNGTFDDTDNMKANDNSYSNFTSTEAVPIPDEFIDGATFVKGSKFDGDYPDSWVDDANYFRLNPIYVHPNWVLSGTFTFAPVLGGRDFYISAHIETNTAENLHLKVNGIDWKVSNNIDFDDELKTGVNSIEFYLIGVYTSTDFFYFKLVEDLVGQVAVLNFTVDLDFSEVDASKLLALDVSSHHYTNVSTTIIGNVYDYDSGTYTQMFSSSNTAETENTFSDESSVDNYLNSSGNLRLQFTGTNTSDTFKLLIDYIKVSFYYKMDLTHSITFETNGLWKYRWILFGSIQYTSWTYFEVVDPVPNFYAISESDLTTRWILQGAEISPVEDFHDAISADYWNLDDVSENYFTKFISNYLSDNISVAFPIEEVQYTGTHFDTGTQDSLSGYITWDGTHFWITGNDNNEVYKYYSNGTYTGTHFDTGIEMYQTFGITWDGTHFWIIGGTTKDVYKYDSSGTYTTTHFDIGTVVNYPSDIVWDGTHFWINCYDNDEVYKYYSNGTYTGTHFDVGTEDGYPMGITWDGTHFWIAGDSNNEVYKYNSSGTYTGTHFDVGTEDGWVSGITWDETHFWVIGGYHDEAYKYEPKNNISKNYFGSGYMYMQTNTTESISLKSIDYTTHKTLSSGDYFEVDFQTSSDSQINLILLKDGSVNKTLTLMQSGNSNFNRRTVQISTDELVEFDQLKISSTLEDEDYVKIYDIKTKKYTITGDYADFYVGSNRDYEVYLTPDTYNLRISEEGDEKVNTNITIPATGVLQHIYTPIERLECRLALFNTMDESLDFMDYHIKVNRSLNGVYNEFWLLDSIFSADTDTYAYISVYDRFDTLIDTFERLTSEYIDLEIEVYSLQIKNLMEQQTTIDINSTHVYPLLSGDSLYFMLSKNYYNIGFYNEYSLYENFTIYLNSNQAYQLNSSLKTIYFSMFTYDGLGINHDLVRFYINDVRKDFGFNSMLDDTLHLIILDFFNNTLADETIDANAYDNSEYNLFVEIYSLNILNRFTYEDMIINITQVNSGVYMNQLIPASSSLLYRFIPSINYTIVMTYLNDTIYSIRTINLTSNNQIESFGIPTTGEEYPKDVYFGVYTSTGLGIDFDLLRLYIDGTRTNFGFNRIEDMVISVIVRDYFNSTLFNQLINTSGIYEYNILVDLYSIKFLNDGIETMNYTLTLSGSTIENSILPSEIIQYNLASNTYIFAYTNQEDDSYHTFSIVLDANKYYILNTTYYNIYFTLYDLNIHVFDSSQYEFRLNDTIKDFGMIVSLKTDYYNITVKDRFGIYLFNDIINLRDLNEYRIDITLYEIQIRHLANQNSNITIIELTTNIDFSFIMAPDIISSLLIASSNYSITWINGENNKSTAYSINLNSDYILTLETTYYEVYFSIYNYDGLGLDINLFKFYINYERAPLGFNTLNQNENNLTILDYFNSTLYSNSVNLSGFNEFNIQITVFTVFVVNNFNRTIQVEVERANKSFSFILGARMGFQLKMLPSMDYTISAYEIDDTLIKSKDITLDEEYLVVDFGFYDEAIPDIPDFNALNTWLMIILIVIACSFVIAFLIYIANRYRKKSENYRRSYADKVTLEAETIKDFSQGKRIR